MSFPRAGMRLGGWVFRDEYAAVVRRRLCESPPGALSEPCGLACLAFTSDSNESGKIWNRRVIEELVKQFTDYLAGLIHVVFGFSSYDIEQPRASAIRFRVRTVMFSIAPHSMRDTTDWVVFIRAAKSCWLMFNSIRRFTACSIRTYNGARES